MGTTEHTSRLSARTAALSVLASAFLAIGKFALGIFTGSVAILSEAVNSCSDVLAALVAYWAIRAGAKPPDHQHPYGHERAENLASLLEGALVVAAGAFVAVESMRRLANGGQVVDHVGLGAAVMAVSACVSLVVALRVRHVARQTGSPALAGDAAHLGADVVMSVAVVIGLVLVAATGRTWLDGAVALAVAAVVVATGVRLCWAGAQVLVDRNLPDDEIDRLEAVLARFSDEGMSFHKLRGRRAGSKRHIDLHMVVPPETTVRQGHQLTGRVKQELSAAVGNAEVLIHLEDH